MQSRGALAAIAALAGAGTVAHSESSWFPWRTSAPARPSGRVLVWGAGHGKTPQELPGVPEATAVAVGDGIGAAVDAGGSIYAFRPGGAGAQLVEGVADARAVAVRSAPPQVVVLDGAGRVLAADVPATGAPGAPRVLQGALRGARVQSVRCGRAHCAAVDAAGRAFAWGAGNAHGQLGNGRVDASPPPQGEEDPEVPAAMRAPDGKRFVGVDCGDRHTILVDDKGAVYGAGDDHWAQLGRAAEPWVAGQGEPSGEVRQAQLIADLPVAAVACGAQHTVVLVRDGTVFSFGYNAWGQLGHHNFCTFAPPSPLADLTLRAVAISAGDNHTCALLGDGSVRCIGANESGQLGVGTLQPSMQWKHIKSMSDRGRKSSVQATSVSLGGNVCAVICDENPTTLKD